MGFWSYWKFPEGMVGTSYQYGCIYVYIYIWASIPRQNPKNPHPMVMGLYSSAPVPPPPVVWVVVGGGGGGRSCICMYLYMII